MNFRPERPREAPGPKGRQAVSRPAGRTSSAVEAQTLRAYRDICLWLGHFYAVLTLWRWFLLEPTALRGVLALESLIALVLFYGAGLLIHRLVPRLGGLENFGLVIIGLAVGNAVFLVAWLPGEVQLVNFVLVQVAASVALRSPWRFALSQVLCMGSTVLSVAHWMGAEVVWRNVFILLSELLVSVMLWFYLNRLLRALAVLRMKDWVLLRQRTRLVRDLRRALANVRTLQGLIPICAHCKRVRDDEGFWQQVESYVHDRSGAKFSHGICPACRVKVQTELEAMKASWTPDRLGP